MGEFIGLVAVVCIFGVPIVAVLTNHMRQMAEIKGRTAGVDSTLGQELQEIKRQISELRDTTTKYDISFDAALQRMESRMTNVEQRLVSVEREVNSAEVRSR